MREVFFTEAGRTVSAPVERLRDMEDLRPELVRLVSPCPGDYRLYLPYGVGSGPSQPDAVVVGSYRFVDLLRPAPEYADGTRPYRP